MLLIRISAVYGTEACSPSWLRGFSAKHPVCLFLHSIWSIKKFSFPPKSLCRGIAQSAVHRNDNDHSGRKSSPGKLSMAKCRTATASREAAYRVRRHAEKIRQFLVFCDIPAAGEQDVRRRGL